MQGLVQVKLFLKSFHHLGSKLGIEGVYLAGFPRRQVNDQKGYDGDKEKSNRFLNHTAADK